MSYGPLQSFTGIIVSSLGCVPNPFEAEEFPMAASKSNCRARNQAGELNLGERLRYSVIVGLLAHRRIWAAKSEGIFYPKSISKLCVKASIYSKGGKPVRFTWPRDLVNPTLLSNRFACISVRQRMSLSAPMPFIKYPLIRKTSSANWLQPIGSLAGPSLEKYTRWLQSCQRAYPN